MLMSGRALFILKLLGVFLIVFQNTAGLTLNSTAFRRHKNNVMPCKLTVQRGIVGTSSEIRQLRGRKEDEEEEDEEEEVEEEEEESQPKREDDDNNHKHRKSKCQPKKKLIIDVGNSGMGNRILSISSAAFLALKLDRVLEILWESNLGCQAKYQDLFSPAGALAIHFKPLVYWGEGNMPNSAMLTRQYCMLYFNIERRLQSDKELFQFNILRDPDLLQQVDEFCDVIHIRSNLYWTHLVLGREIQKYGKYGYLDMYSRYPRPFHDISQNIFRPAPHIMEDIERVKDDMFRRANLTGNQKLTWISVHARNIFTEKARMISTFNCVNKLIAEKTATLVLFTADTLFLRQLAFKLIADKNAFYEVRHPADAISSTKHLQGDTFEIRSKKGMEFATLEWFLIGEADYCLSPTIGTSTFSKTAIARGNCKYISFHASDDCDVWDDSVKDKEIFLKLRSDVIKDEESYFTVPNVPNSTKVWNSVKRYMHNTNEQCMAEYPNIADDIIAEYWRPLTNKKGVEGKEERLKTLD